MSPTSPSALQANLYESTSTRVAAICGSIQRLPDFANHGAITADQPVLVSMRSRSRRGRTDRPPDSANQSSTYNYLSSAFNITYADQSGANGDYGTDTLVFGGSTIQEIQFGIGYVSTSPG